MSNPNDARTMKTRRVLEIVEIVSDISDNPNESRPQSNLAFGYRNVTKENANQLDAIIRLADEQGAFGNSIYYFGRVLEVHYDVEGAVRSYLKHPLVLTFDEFNYMGRPKRIQQTCEYEPIREEAPQES